ALRDWRGKEKGIARLLPRMIYPTHRSTLQDAVVKLISGGRKKALGIEKFLSLGILEFKDELRIGILVLEKLAGPLRFEENILLKTYLCQPQIFIHTRTMHNHVTPQGTQIFFEKVNGALGFSLTHTCKQGLVLQAPSARRGRQDLSRA